MKLWAGVISHRSNKGETMMKTKSQSLGRIGGILAAVVFCMASQLGAQPRIDFNGDGYADLAVGVPHEDDGKTTDSGAVNIIYGSAEGLTEVGNKFFTRNTPGVPGLVQKGAQFGKALAAGDFNGDGFTDLAVGAPFADTYFKKSGDVLIFYGGQKGLSGSQVKTVLWLDRSAINSLYGSALAAGDFDADGFDDIAIGAPDAYSNFDEAGQGRGAVLVWYGSRFGMERSQLWLQGMNGLRETSEPRDQFGSALAAADFNGDGKDDLAVGAPGEEGVNSFPIGAVSVLYGQAEKGLVAKGNQVWTQISDGGGNRAEEGDLYGKILGSGDLDGDGCDELLVGAPGDDTLHIIYGRNKGLTSKKTQELGALWPYYVIVSADFDDNGAEDLAIREGRGAVGIYFGDSNGLQDSPKYLHEYLMPGLNSSDDWQRRTAEVGYALAADDFEGRGVFDLAVGMPRYNIPYNHNVLQITGAGAVAVVRNIGIIQNPSPLSETPIIQWSHLLNFFWGNYPNTIHEIFGVAEQDDRFGEVFAH
jgi:hypothetical protein